MNGKCFILTSAVIIFGCIALSTSFGYDDEITILVEEDWESYKVGSSVSIPWTEETGDNGTITIARKDGNKFAILKKSKISKNSVNLVFKPEKPITGEFLMLVMDVRFDFDDTQAGSYLELLIKSADGKIGAHTGMRYGGANNYYLFSYYQRDIDNCTEVATSSWIHIEFFADITNKSYHFYVYPVDPYYAELCGGYNMEWINTFEPYHLDDLYEFIFSAGSNESPTLVSGYVDNLKFYCYNCTYDEDYIEPEQENDDDDEVSGIDSDDANSDDDDDRCSCGASGSGPSFLPVLVLAAIGAYMILRKNNQQKI